MKTTMLGVLLLLAAGCAKYWTREFQLVEVGRLNERVEVSCRLLAFRGVRNADTSLHSFSFAVFLSNANRQFKDTLDGKQWQKTTDQLFTLDSCILSSVNNAWIRAVAPRRKIMGKSYHGYSIITYEMWPIEIPPNVMEIVLNTYFSGESQQSGDQSIIRSKLRLVRHESTVRFIPLD